MLAVDMPFVSRAFLEYLIDKGAGRAGRNRCGFHVCDGGRQPFVRRLPAGIRRRGRKTLLRAGRNKN